jgi:hypothetical protein
MNQRLPLRVKMPVRDQRERHLTAVVGQPEMELIGDADPCEVTRAIAARVWDPTRD